MNSSFTSCKNNFLSCIPWLYHSDFLKGVIELNSYGEIIVSEKGETSSPGIFACGDVTTVPHKQIIISMGEGAKASITASDYLQKNKVEEIMKVSA